MYSKEDCATSFDSFGVENIAEEVKRFKGDNSIIINTSRKQTYDSIICGYFCIGFIDSVFIGQSILYFTNLFSPGNFKKNDKSILNHIFKYSLNIRINI